MLNTFVITLREGVEAALVIGIILAYLRRVGRTALNQYVYRGIISAVAISFLLALLFTQMGINSENELMEGIILIVSCLMVSSLVVWMWLTGKKLKMQIEEKISGYTTRKQAAGIFLVTFFMVGREGIETVLLLTAVSFTSSSILNLLGGLAGILLAVLFCIFFIRGTVRINLKKFFLVTSIALLVFAFQLLVAGIHELFEAEVLPAGPAEMAIVGPLVRNEGLFIVLALLVPLVMVIISSLRKGKDELETITDQAQRRLAKAKLYHQRIGTSMFGVLAILIISALGLSYLYSKGEVKLDPPKRLEVKGNVVILALADLEKGKLYRLEVDLSPRLVRFLVMRLKENKVVAALDACRICGDFGYYQEGSSIICRNCTAEINPITIGQPGGCNPIPLPCSVRNGMVEIAVSDIRETIEREGPHLFLDNQDLIKECPVCKMKIKVTESKEGFPYEYKHNKLILYFCPQRDMPCKEKFLKDPEKYLN